MSSKSKAGYIDARPLTANSTKPLATHGRTIHSGQPETTAHDRDTAAFLVGADIYRRPPPSMSAKRSSQSLFGGVNRQCLRRKFVGRDCVLSHSRVTRLDGDSTESCNVHSDGGPTRANLGTGSCRSRFPPSRGNIRPFDDDAVPARAAWISASELKAAFLVVSLSVAERPKAAFVPEFRFVAEGPIAAASGRGRLR